MSDKSTALRERLAARGVKYETNDFKEDDDGYQDKFTNWRGNESVQWTYHEILHDGHSIFAKIRQAGFIEPEQAVAVTLGTDVEPLPSGRHESFAAVVNVLRKAAMGDFPGASGTVDENLLTLMDRGRGDSLAGAFDELADRLEDAHNREVAEKEKLREYVSVVANDVYKGDMFNCMECRFFEQCYNCGEKEHKGNGCQWWLWARELGIEV